MKLNLTPKEHETLAGLLRDVTNNEEDQDLRVYQNILAKLEAITKWQGLGRTKYSTPKVGTLTIS